MACCCGSWCCRSLKCSTKLVQPAIAQAQLSLPSALFRSLSICLSRSHFCCRLCNDIFLLLSTAALTLPKSICGKTVQQVFWPGRRRFGQLCGKRNNNNNNSSNGSSSNSNSKHKENSSASESPCHCHLPANRSPLATVDWSCSSACCCCLWYCLTYSYYTCAGIYDYCCCYCCLWSPAVFLLALFCLMPIVFFLHDTFYNFH